MTKSKEHFEASARRNKYEIWVEILSLCSYQSMKLSGIMRELRLRTGKCKEYLIFLIQHHLLQISRDEEDGNIKYTTSEKGKNAVKDFFHLLGTYFD
jgi:predicted transcriptional regulator